jgi:hypothetical protein
MPLSFETQMKRIGELFSDAAVFVMPAFQRPYCWDEDAAAQLYDDISSAMLRGAQERPGRKNRQEYFLGPIIVTCERGVDGCNVIDGQQRLATLAIILAVLRDALPPESELRFELQRMIIRPEHKLRKLVEHPRVYLRKADQERFFEWVQTLGGTIKLPEEDDSDSCTRILEAISRIQRDIGECQESYIKQLASFILTNCYVIQIAARDLDDGYVLFRSLNSRGQPLNELDLAKAELLGAKAIGTGIDMKALADYWEKAQSSLAPDEFEEYMRAVLSLVATRPQGRDLRDLMKEVIGDEVKARNFRFLIASVLHHAAKLDDGQLEFGADSDQIHRVFECLRHSPVGEWRSVALAWLAMNPSGLHTLQFLTALENLCLGLWVLGRNKTQILRRLKAVANDVVSQKENILKQAGSLRFTAQEQAQLRVVLASPMGAKKRFLKPLLLRLNAQMLPPQIPIYFPSGVTIEHVLPRNPKPNGAWSAKYPDARRRRLCTELLGNYALLTHSINAGAKNKDFKEKRTIMFSQTNNQAFPLTTDLMHYEEWGESDMKARHEKLVRLAWEMLGLAPALAWPAAAE